MMGSQMYFKNPLKSNKINIQSITQYMNRFEVYLYDSYLYNVITPKVWAFIEYCEILDPNIRSNTYVQSVYLES